MVGAGFFVSDAMKQMMFMMGGLVLMLMGCAGSSETTTSGMAQRHDAVMASEGIKKNAKGRGNEQAKDGGVKIRYKLIEGKIAGDRYVSADGFMSCEVPQLEWPGDEVKDGIDEGLGMRYVRFTDHAGRYYAVLWGRPLDMKVDPMAREMSLLKVAADFLMVDRKWGEVTQLETFYDAAILGGSQIAIDRWAQGSWIVKKDAAGKTAALDRIYAVLYTLAGERDDVIVKVVVHDRVHATEHGMKGLDEKPNDWTLERRKVLLDELFRFAMTIKFGRS